MAANTTLKELGLYTINNCKSEIGNCEDYIMSERLSLIRELQRADDVNDVYRAIKNAMIRIEEQRYTIDYNKDAIVALYDKIMEEEK